MHGFNQGFTVIENLIKEDLPDLLLVQEHWLTPGNLYKFEKFFPEYFFFGCSAMDNQPTYEVDSGILRGRPFGGVATLIHTRSSADADNRLDAFSGQSRSTNMVPFHM